MEQQDIEIEISKSGEVRVHVKGVKGARCLKFVELFEEIVGPLKEQQLTGEYYERDGKTRVDAEAEQHVREADV